MSKIAQKRIVAHVRTCTQILASLLFTFFSFLPKNDSDIQYAMVQRVHRPGVGGGGIILGAIHGIQDMEPRRFERR